MKVEDLMSKKLLKIKPEASVLEAVHMLNNEGVTSLLVEGRNATDYGIVTRKDIIHKVIAKDLDIRKTRVSAVMSTPLITVPPNMPVQTVAMLMAKSSIRRFPVVEGKKIVGLISNSDILKASISR